MNVTSLRSTLTSTVSVNMISANAASKSSTVDKSCSPDTRNADQLAL